MRALLAPALLAALALTACPDRAPAPADGPEATGRPLEEAKDAGAPAPDGAAADAGTAAEPAWTARSTALSGTADTPVTVRAIRTGAHADYDRIVFELAGDTRPGVKVSYVDRPVRRCGSDEVVALPGDGWLEIRLEPAQAHDEAGEATVQDRARTLSLPVMKGLAVTCDFEGVLTTVVGVRSPNPYRVRTLEGPGRVVVDVRHD